jgi:hypothetical protein
MSLHFGLGQVALIPSGATPTPVPVALLTDVKIEGSYKEVEFRGNKQFPQEIAFGEGGLKITAKNANINGATLSALLAGSTSAAGSVLGVLGELVTIPGTPYQVTVANGATYADDLGVLDLTANKWLTRVAAGATTGQYVLNAATGQYTFAAADTTHNLSANYAYTSPSIGVTVTLNNQLAGTTPLFALACYNAYTIGGTTRYMGVRFPAVVCPKLSLSLSPAKFTEQDLSFTVRQDASSALVAKAYTQE